jgi:surface antigen
MKVFKKAAAIALAGCFAVSACATTNADGTPFTVQQRISRCVGMVAVGAVLGAVIGNNVGSGDAGQGAAIGAAAGLGTCAVWLAFQSEQDQARIQEMQMAAARTGQPQSQTWLGADQRSRTVTVVPSTETNLQANGSAQMCRTMNTRAEVAGRGDTIDQVWCRQADGSYAPANIPADSVG